MDWFAWSLVSVSSFLWILLLLWLCLCLLFFLSVLWFFLVWFCILAFLLFFGSSVSSHLCCRSPGMRRMVRLLPCWLKARDGEWKSALAHLRASAFPHWPSAVEMGRGHAISDYRADGPWTRYRFEGVVWESSSIRGWTMSMRPISGPAHCPGGLAHRPIGPCAGCVDGPISESVGTVRYRSSHPMWLIGHATGP